MALANGGGDRVTVRHLHEAQHSKHVMLLHAVAEAAGAAAPGSLSPHGFAAFGAGYKLLTSVQAAKPDAVAWLLGLPHAGGWAHDCLAALDLGQPADLGYLASAAAAAAVKAGVRFEIEVPVRDGRVPLPGLGSFTGVGDDDWIRLYSDGERLTVGTIGSVSCADAGPDDGSGPLVPHWQGTFAVRAVADGQTWQVLVETTDRHLDQYMLPMADLTADEITLWRHCLRRAWALLVRHHGWAAGPISEGLSVIVPIAARRDTDLDSATTLTAFGAIATSLPPDPVMMAETLVHEFQHLKLCGVMDLMPLIKPCRERVYAPWRPDPRPAGGLLQGVYAHLGVARFWDAQRRVETEPDDRFRAQVTYERWRPTIELCAETLLRAGCLTQAGIRFVEIIRDQGRRLETGTAGAVRLAEEVALDHWLTWQLRHTAADPAQVAALAAAYQRGEPLGTRPLPEVRVQEEVRTIGSTIRSRLLNTRHLEPRRYARQVDADMPGLSQADFLLLEGPADAAAQEYRDDIAAAADPLPEAWIGLGLAVNRQAPTSLRQVFATQLPLIFDMYDCLHAQGVKSDPLDLADWFA